MTPYQRELRLMPVIAQMEQQGINLNIDALSEDTNFYFKKLDELDQQIASILHAKIDVDSNEDLADAIQVKYPNAQFFQTPKGRRSVAKESLLNALNQTDPQLLGSLLVRGAIATCVRTFYQPWLTQVQQYGRLYMRWNQFRNYTDTGARTGRISSSPNLQNIPVTWEKLKKQLQGIGYIPAFPLPIMRKYIVPAPGHIFLGRDYSAQEMRLLAHFAGGALLDMIVANPSEDIHQIASKLAGISRSEAKTLGFAILYGAGVGRIAESLDISVSLAGAIKAKYLERLPEIKRFTKSLSELSAAGMPILTLAGRQYFVEQPKVVEGRLRSFEYKLANYKIQGSAADQTKEAMWRYYRNTKYGRIVLTVHDQLVVEVPEERIDYEEEVLEDAMDMAYQDVLKYTIVSDPGQGYSFADLKTESEKPMPTVTTVGGVVNV